VLNQEQLVIMFLTVPTVSSLSYMYSDWADADLASGTCRMAQTSNHISARGVYREAITAGTRRFVTTYFE